MKTYLHTPQRWLACAAMLMAVTLPAYPPAPHHVIYGQVRDEMGEPITLTDAQVILETTKNISVQSIISPNLEPGLNYQLQVPMDSGIKPDLYKPNALELGVTFRLQVAIGNTLYLPLEMVGDLAMLGLPAQKTRIDLTLGEDTDEDGIPDAWERALIAALGGGLTLADIGPDDDSDGDGLTNMQEYLAGTYAFDPEDGFFLALTQVDAQGTSLEFLAIRGRTYSIYETSDLEQWTPVAFSIASEGPDAPLRNSYQATDVRILRAFVPHESGLEARRYFKAMVQ